MEKKIAHLMKSLNISREKALEVIEADARIDRGEKLFDLAPELEAGAKKARQADRKTTGPIKREKKANPAKADIINCMAEALTENGFSDSLEITNAEREFLFIYNGIKYKVTLACPRK